MTAWPVNELPPAQTLATQSPGDERRYWDANTGPLADPNLGSLDDWIAAVTVPLTLPTGARVCDLGCGEGRLLIPLAQRGQGADWYGYDICDHHVEACRRNRPAHLRNCGALACDGRTIPVRGDYFDGAYSVLLFQHLDEVGVSGYLSELARVVRPGGVVRFQFVERWQSSPPNHPMDHHHDPGRVQSTCEDLGLEVVGVEHGLLYEQWCWMTAQSTRSI